MSAPGGLGSSSGIFRRKPIDQIQDTSEAGGLKRTLGLWQLTAIGVGGIIGAGIFALAGSVAHGDDSAGIPGVGPAVLISFLIAGVASAAAAFSYAEFAGMIPKAGSAYTYGYAVLGEIVGWFIGWDLLLEYTAIVVGRGDRHLRLLQLPARPARPRPARLDARRARHRRRATRSTCSPCCCAC